MSPIERARRAIDHPVYRAIERLGFPIVMAVLLFWAWDGDRKAERAESVRREDRLVQVIDRLKISIDASADASRATTTELGRLAERVRVLEEMGSRAMARQTQLQHPTNRPE